MRLKSIEISGKETTFFNNDIATFLSKMAKKEKIILFIDSNVYATKSRLFETYDCFLIAGRDTSKTLTMVKKMIDFLFEKNADRQTLIIGIGGGVVTDITGFVASVFMRGVRFGFVPTTILAMVDASLGGKNGINWGKYKNMVGTISQPEFLLYDYQFLDSLPHTEWIEGFAEIIKHACIYDTNLFQLLEKNDIKKIKKDTSLLKKLIEKNIAIKYDIVQQDPHEKKLRRLLNFGHTLAHALEKSSTITHGRAVAIGIYYMSIFSRIHEGFTHTGRIHNLLMQYELPSQTNIYTDKILQVMLRDKKREKQYIFEILLKKIGEAKIVSFATDDYISYIKQSLTKAV